MLTGDIRLKTNPSPKIADLSTGDVAIAVDMYRYTSTADKRISSFYDQLTPSVHMYSVENF